MPVRKVAAGQVEGNSKGGQFAADHTRRDEPGQVEVPAPADFQWHSPDELSGPEHPDLSGAIGEVATTTKWFDDPTVGRVRVTVYNYVSASSGYAPVGADEHANAAYEQYGEDSDGTEQVDGLEYDVVTVTRAWVPGLDKNTFSHSIEVESVDCYSDFQEFMPENAQAIDWEVYYDPIDFEDPDWNAERAEFEADTGLVPQHMPLVHEQEFTEGGEYTPIGGYEDERGMVGTFTVTDKDGNHIEVVQKLSVSQDDKGLWWNIHQSEQRVTFPDGTEGYRELLVGNVDQRTWDTEAEAWDALQDARRGSMSYDYQYEVGAFEVIQRDLYQD